MEISRYFLDNHQQCSCFPSHPASVLFLGESQVIFLLLSFLSNPQFSPFLTPSHSVFLSLTRRIVSSLYISRSVAAASVILRHLALSLKKAQAVGTSDLDSSSSSNLKLDSSSSSNLKLDSSLSSNLKLDSSLSSNLKLDLDSTSRKTLNLHLDLPLDHPSNLNSDSDLNVALPGILSADPLFQKIPLRRISDILQLNQRNLLLLLLSTQPSTSLFPSFFPWYLSHSHGPLLDLLTAVKITSSAESVATHTRLRFREFLYSLCMENCRILRQLRDYSLARQAFIVSFVTLIRNCLSFRSDWTNLPEEERQELGISECDVDAMHLEVLLGCILVAWEMWDVSLLQIAMKALHHFDLGVWEIAERLENQTIKTNHLVLAGETPTIVEMTTFIAINLLRSSIIDSIVSIFKQQMAKSAAYLDESITRRWKDQISYLEQWKKNLLGLMVSFGPGELEKGREHLSLYFSRFLQGAKAAFSPPSLQTLWEQEGGKQALKAFVDRLDGSSSGRRDYHIRYSHNELVWKWNDSSCTVQRQSSRTLRISINGNPRDCCFSARFGSLPDAYLPNTFDYHRDIDCCTRQIAQRKCVDAICPYMALPACLVASHQRQALYLEVIRLHSKAQMMVAACFPLDSRTSAISPARKQRAISSATSPARASSP